MNVFTFFFGPWALIPIGGLSIGLYFHFVIIRELLAVSGASTNELNRIETPVQHVIEQIKNLTSTAYNIAKQSYENMCGNGNKE